MEILSPPSIFPKKKHFFFLTSSYVSTVIILIFYFLFHEKDTSLCITSTKPFLDKSKADFQFFVNESVHYVQYHSVDFVRMFDRNGTVYFRICRTVLSTDSRSVKFSVCTPSLSRRFGDSLYKEVIVSNNCTAFECKLEEDGPYGVKVYTSELMAFKFYYDPAFSQLYFLDIRSLGIFLPIESVTLFFRHLSNYVL